MRDLDELGIQPRDLLPATEMLAQLAEECCELGQAALHLRRVLDDTNPTRTGYIEAVTKFNEEWADVLLTVRNTSCIDEKAVLETIRQKKDRWVKHLIRHRKEEENG